MPVLGLGALVCLCVVTFLSAADELSQAVAIVVPRIEPPRQGLLDPIITDHSSTDVQRGVAMGLLTLFFGGVPLALVGLAVSAYSRRSAVQWSPIWAHIFFTAFAFQLCSLALTTLLLIGLAIARPAYGEMVGFGVPLLLSVTCSVGGLRAWWMLQRAVVVTPLQITTGRSGSLRERTD